MQPVFSFKYLCMQNSNQSLWVVSTVIFHSRRALSLFKMQDPFIHSGHFHIFCSIETKIQIQLCYLPKVLRFSILRFVKNLNTRISYIKAFMHRMPKTYSAVLYPLYAIPDLYFIERSIKLDISNRIDDASATAAPTIYPIV